MSVVASILTYHSQNVCYPHAHSNDHAALAQDLETLHASGYRVLPLTELIDVLDSKRPESHLDKAVFLTFDDGCDMDFRDIDFPTAGPQRSFYGILQDFIARHGHSAQPGLHASSFVIASRQARTALERKAFDGQAWISDDWWRTAQQSGLLSIENHGWDHFHDAPEPDQESAATQIRTQDAFELQVLRANDVIAGKSGRRPRFFAYPYGHTGSALPEVFLPAHSAQHQLLGALSTEPAHVHAHSNRWLLPRWVCGRDWNDGTGLQKLLRAHA